MEWKRNSQMSRSTFVYLCSKLCPKLQRAHQVRAPIPVETKVTIALWRRGTNIEYRITLHLFGVGISTLCVIVHGVCRKIVRCLLHTYIKILQGHEAMAIVRGFRDQWGFPQCFGAVDGSHIPIITPENCANDYHNRKKFSSIVLQAMVDNEYHFMNVYARCRGSVHTLFNSRSWNPRLQFGTNNEWSACACCHSWRSILSTPSMVNEFIPWSGIERQTQKVQHST